MASREQLKAELAELVKNGREILTGLFDGEGDGGFYFTYQAWYTTALGAVRSLASDRLEEFRRYYEPDPKRKSLGYGDYVIQDYVKGVVPSRMAYPDFDSREQAGRGVLNQIAILESINCRIDSVLGDMEAHLQADMQDAELETASKLVGVSPRAAGALAGVVLERHLQTVAQSRGVRISKRHPTIGDLNEPLKQSGSYDTPTWRKISYLGDLRNLCSHKKTQEPSAEQARELIEGVNWAIKNVG